MGLFGIGSKKKKKVATKDVTVTPKGNKKPEVEKPEVEKPKVKRIKQALPDPKGAKPKKKEKKKEKAKTKGPDIDNLPLEQRDHKCLARNRYNEVSQKHQTTYVIQIIRFEPTMDRPNRFVRKNAELKAASAWHACNLIGWRPRSCRLVQVIEPEKRDIEVRVDGKVVGGMLVDPFIDQMPAKDRAEVEAAVQKEALAAKPVTEALQKRKRVVEKVIIHPRRSVNIRTKKFSVVKLAA